MPKSPKICPFLTAISGVETNCVREKCQLNFKTKRDTNNCSLKIMAAALVVMAQTMSSKSEIPTDNIQSTEDDEG